ncbi:MAG: hypothetical protein ACO3SJ_03715, partial [Phycisphaerales bacterium]
MTDLAASLPHANGLPAESAAGLRQRCELLGIEWLEKAPSISEEALALLEADVAVRLRAVPYAIDGRRLVVAMADPTDLASVDELAAMTGRAIRRVGIEHAAFAELMRLGYGTTAARMAQSLADES